MQGGLLLVVMTAMVFSQGVGAKENCMDLFASRAVEGGSTAPVVDPTVKPDVAVAPAAPAVAQKPPTKEEVIDFFELGPQIVERSELSRAELDHLVTETRHLLRDDSVTRENVFAAIFAAKREFDAQINNKLDFLGQRITTSIRAMRKRRLRFAADLKTGDTIAAIKVYRSLWEAYYISRSKLLQYITAAPSRKRDKDLVDSSKYILLALTKGTFADLKKQVDAIYNNPDNVPTASQVLSIYDQIYARTNDEFRYARYYFETVRADMAADAMTKENLDYIDRRMNVDEISKTYGIRLLRQGYLDSDGAGKLLHRARPQITVWWLKYSMQQQSQFGLWLITKSVVQNIAVKMTQFLPATVRDAVRAVLMLNYNSYVISVHLESIDAVINAAPEVRQAVFERALAGRAEHTAQFLETLARLSSHMTLWNELRAKIDTLAKDNENYKVIQAQMIEAEKGIREYGWVTTIHESSVFDTAVGITIRGGVPLVTALVVNWDAVASWTMSVTHAATTVANQGWETVGQYTNWFTP